MRNRAGQIGELDSVFLKEAAASALPDGSPETELAALGGGGLTGTSLLGPRLGRCRWGRITASLRPRSWAVELPANQSHLEPSFLTGNFFTTFPVLSMRTTREPVATGARPPA